MRLSEQRYLELLELGYPKEKAYLQLLESALRYCGKTKDENSSLYQEAVDIVKKGSSVHLNGKIKIMKWLLCFNSRFYRIVYSLAMCF